MPGKLSTHVLDLIRGGPAAGMRIELWRPEGERRLVKSLRADADGRAAGGLLPSGELSAGAYEIVFHVREYFAGRGIACVFLDQVPVRFEVADPEASYHVPLLVTPWSYSTYRGS